MEQTNSKSNKSTVLLLALLLLAIVGGGYFWNQSRSLIKTNESLNMENEDLSMELDAIEELRLSLLEDIEVLQGQYDEIINSSDSLQLIFKAATQEVASKKAEIKKIKKEFAKDAAGMKAEVSQLRAIKKELTGLVGQLKAENLALKESNQSLVTKVANIEAKNKELEFQISGLRSLTKDLEKENENFMAESTRAANFLVNIKKKGDKPTGSARRAREISVSFDLKNIPEAKQGDHNIYILIKDAKGLPVKVSNPVKATITAANGGQKQEIIAQQVKRVNLFIGVRRKFDINPEPGSLHTGY